MANLLRGPTASSVRSDWHRFVTEPADDRFRARALRLNQQRDRRAATGTSPSLVLYALLRKSGAPTERLCHLTDLCKFTRLLGTLLKQADDSPLFGQSDAEIR